MVEIELIGVPFDGYGRAGHQARAAAVLRQAGLANAWGERRVRDSGEVLLPAPDPRRGRTSLINENALVSMVDVVGARVAAAVSSGRFPVVHGGDCTTLLGTVPALQELGGVVGGGRIGLVFIDGHEDTMPLDVSEDGEAANTELGLLLGLTGRLLTGPLSQRRGALTLSEVAVLGPRDEAWRRRFNVGSLRAAGVWLRNSQEVTKDPRREGAAAVRHVQTSCQRWWLHVDLDVLDPNVFAAQGLPGVPDDPGGLSWASLTELLVAALGEGGCVGWSIAIYDPDQDQEGNDAQRIVALVEQLAEVVGKPAERGD